MKNIFKKNQIIITALAIMIVIAGYLSFTNTDTPDESLETINPDVDDLNDFANLDIEGLDLATNDTGDDQEDLEDADEENAADTGEADDVNITAEDEDEADEVVDEEENYDDMVPVDTEEDDGIFELGDISDQDILEASVDVTDNNELDVETVPGEAVLASSTIDASYFPTTKLQREQLRAKNKANYKEIMESLQTSEAQKQDAIDNLIAITNIAEMENATEISLGARGFSDVVVSINNDKVDVIINAATLSDQQLAIIEDVVKTKTGAEVKNIKITPVVIEE